VDAPITRITKFCDISSRIDDGVGARFLWREAHDVLGCHV